MVITRRFESAPTHVHQHREVRVTPRKSVKSPFVAPELSPVRVVDLEIEKLEGRDWSDYDVMVPDLTGSHLARGHETSLVRQMRVGTVIRKAPDNKAIVRRPKAAKRRWKG